MTAVKVILGIDPGSLYTGFGAVRVQGSRIELVSCGAIAPPGEMDFNARIGIIADEVEALIAKLKPQVTVIERIFLGKSADSVFKLGHARGVAVAGAIRAGSEVVEYASRAVKKGITGNGAAAKEQVQAVLFATLGLPARTQMRLDASDALALAVYHAKQIEVRTSIARNGRRPSEREL